MTKPKFSSTVESTSEMIIKFISTWCIKTQIEDNAGSIAESLSSIDVSVFSATDNNASSGHFVYQSIVQQLTNEGNIRHRRLKGYSIRHGAEMNNWFTSIPECVSDGTHAQHKMQMVPHSADKVSVYFVPCCF